MLEREEIKFAIIIVQASSFQTCAPRFGVPKLMEPRFIVPRVIVKNKFSWCAKA